MSELFVYILIILSYVVPYRSITSSYFVLHCIDFLSVITMLFCCTRNDSSRFSLVLSLVDPSYARCYSESRRLELYIRSISPNRSCSFIEYLECTYCTISIGFCSVIEFFLVFRLFVYRLVYTACFAYSVYVFNLHRRRLRHRKFTECSFFDYIAIGASVSFSLCSLAFHIPES